MKYLFLLSIFSLLSIASCTQKRQTYQYEPYATSPTAHSSLPVPAIGNTNRSQNSSFASDSKAKSAPSSRSKTASKNSPNREKAGTIVVDAGHGGDDFGTHSLGTPKFQEKHLNIATAKLLQTYLQQFGYTVLMTRSDDTFVSLDKRSLFANNRNPKLFVSIHYNSAPSKEAEGIEVFYFRNDENKLRTAKSKLLAQSILDKTIHHTQAKSRGVKHGNYAVLRETIMPSVLVEGGFLSNNDEMEKIKDPAYQKKLALGIAQGIDHYLSKERVMAEN